MILPVKCSTALWDEINLTVVEKGFVVWWLGQSGYAIKSKESLIFIDAYLSEHLTQKYANAKNPHIRMTESPLVAADIHQFDALLSTHKHSDHMDPKTFPDMLQNCETAKFIFPRKHVDYIKEFGVNEGCFVAADVGSQIAIKDITIIPIPAKHEAFDYTPEDGYPCVSYIIKTDGCTLYHSGDTIPFVGMTAYLQEHHVNVAFMPINGRDARRHSYGTPGNCTMEESMCICTCAGVQTMIPHHYDMFTFNTVDMAQFNAQAKELYPELYVKVLECGQKTIILEEET